MKRRNMRRESQSLMSSWLIIVEYGVCPKKMIEFSALVYISRQLQLEETVAKRHESTLDKLVFKGEGHISLFHSQVLVYLNASR
jgi:hypothetical protein